MRSCRSSKYLFIVSVVLSEFNTAQNRSSRSSTESRCLSFFCVFFYCMAEFYSVFGFELAMTLIGDSA